MIAGLDSASEPSAAQARAAKAAGVRLWSGYIATQPNVGLYHPWPQSAFENARLCGGTPIAYASGWDDPVACKALAAAWNLRLCLDIEGGIRGDGSWAQNWLDASGAGVYGNSPVHRLRAAFHVLAAYPGGDPRATWPSYLAHPSTPCGWQFQGTHSEFGIGVDRGWFDDFFAGQYSGGSGGLGDDMGEDTPVYKELRGDKPYSKLDLQATALDRIEASLASLVSKGVVVDQSAVLAAIADIKAHPAAADPTLAAKIDALAKHLGAGTP